MRNWTRSWRRSADRGTDVYRRCGTVCPAPPESRPSSGRLRLFECIGVGRRDCCAMRKGSPQDYTAEIGCSKQPTQKSRLGEPHECYSLYRIGHTQENYQFLRKDGRWPDCGRRQTAGGADGVAALGGGSKTSLVVMRRHDTYSPQSGSNRFSVVRRMIPTPSVFFLDCSQAETPRLSRFLRESRCIVRQPSGGVI